MKRFLTLVLAGTVLAGSAAFAQSDYRRDPTPQTQIERDRLAREHAAEERARADRLHQEQRADWEHARWSRGDRLPPEFRDHNHIVTDWRAFHLRRPPSGYEWVRAGDRFILVSSRSGIIAELAEMR
jgi:Ni/Co efflux regulator RcnB